MEQPTRWDILESAPAADEATVSEHFTGFVNSFVEKHRRERWLHLLLKRPEQIYTNSHKLHNHLDWSSCSKLKDESELNPKAKGVYYGFSDEPVVLTVAEAFMVGPERVGVFSIVPGKLAIYFFHELENYLCKN